LRRKRSCVLEGSFGRDKVVVLEFPDHAAAMAFQGSSDYAAIAVDRKAGADAVVLMVRGAKGQAQGGTQDRIKAIDAWALTQAPH
jgi:uncharacterized protein (DUF1330 family)